MSTPAEMLEFAEQDLKTTAGGSRQYPNDGSPIPPQRSDLLTNDKFVEAIYGHVPSAEGGPSRAERVLAILKNL